MRDKENTSIHLLMTIGLYVFLKKTFKVNMILFIILNKLST